MDEFVDLHMKRYYKNDLEQRLIIETQITPERTRFLWTGSWMFLMTYEKRIMKEPQAFW